MIACAIQESSTGVVNNRRYYRINTPVSENKEIIDNNDDSSVYNIDSSASSINRNKASNNNNNNIYEASYISNSK